MSSETVAPRLLISLRNDIVDLESAMNRQTSPAPPGWNKTIQDLFDEAKTTRSTVGPPEVEWARDYERSLIPAGTRFPKKGDV